MALGRLAVRFFGMMGIVIGIWLEGIHHPLAQAVTETGFACYFLSACLVTLGQRPWAEARWRKRARRNTELFVGYVALMVLSIFALFHLPELMALNFVVISLGFGIRAHKLDKLDPWPKGQQT